jgi:hypothetical protein
MDETINGLAQRHGKGRQRRRDDVKQHARPGYRFVGCFLRLRGAGLTG